MKPASPCLKELPTHLKAFIWKTFAGFSVSHGLIAAEEGFAVLPRLTCWEKQWIILNLSLCSLKCSDFSLSCMEFQVSSYFSLKIYNINSVIIKLATCLTLIGGEVSGWSSWTKAHGAVNVCTQGRSPQRAPREIIQFIYYLCIKLSVQQPSVRSDCFNY